MAELLRLEYICSFIERYYADCNEADGAKMMGCFTDDAVHYFPPVTHSSPWRNAKTIVNIWVQCVEKLGSHWTLDRILCQHETHESVV